MSTVEVVYPRIDAALAAVVEEIGIVEAEAEAFRMFRSRVDRLEPVETTRPAGGGSLVGTASVAGVDPDAIRDAYRDTVMALDHYERDYGEPLSENVEAEFGTSVRVLLDADVPIPEVQLGVVDAAAEEAVEERRRFRRALEHQRDSLRSVAQRLGEVERRLYEWRQERRSDEGQRSRTAPVEMVGFGSARRERLQELAEECRAISAERQRAIHGGAATALSGIGETSLIEYLYGEDDHRFPALAEVADVAERIETALDG